MANTGDKREIFWAGLQNMHVASLRRTLVPHNVIQQINSWHPAKLRGTFGKKSVVTSSVVQEVKK